VRRRRRTGYLAGFCGHLGRVDDAAAEKIARNNATFRDANERIDETAETFGLDREEPLPFICECSDRRCVEIIGLTLTEYDHVRSNPRWFAHAPNHEEQIAGVVEAVERHSRYVLVEKINRAGDVAAELAADPVEE
jgi:hypothetical protein